MKPEINRQTPDKSRELLHCPSCGFDREAFKKHCYNMRNSIYSPIKWNTYKPIIYKDRFLKRWVIECQNCGMKVFFDMDTREENVDLWNELPRATEGVSHETPD